MQDKSKNQSIQRAKYSIEFLILFIYAKFDYIKPIITQQMKHIDIQTIIQKRKNSKIK
jgi:hypothetical protein